MPQTMPSSYFSFGFDHVHRVDGRTYDVDTVVRVTAPDPRGVMQEMFGREWGAQYDDVPEFAARRGLPVVDIIDLPDRRIVAEVGS